MNSGRALNRSRLALRLASLGMVIGICTGCQTARFYAQAIKGQCEILAKRRSLLEVMADSRTPEWLEAKLGLITRVRAFAETQLQLPVNGHYLSYVDLDRRFVVWSLHAAPEFSLDPKTWWYPVVGALEYRGYFTPEAAEAYATRLRRSGLDVYVEGVEAYSTLGWFRDPILSTFLGHRREDLAEILFHELAHQRVFVAGDTDFNEAFATAVAEEGMRRWLEGAPDSDAYANYQTRLRRDHQVVGAVMEAREQLQALYEEDLPTAALREGKRRILDGLRESYEALKAEWGGYPGYDYWFGQPLNNAQLNTVATYYELVPGFRRLLAECGGDLDRFYDEVERLGALAKEKRHENLICPRDELNAALVGDKFLMIE